VAFLESKWNQIVDPVCVVLIPYGVTNDEVEKHGPLAKTLKPEYYCEQGSAERIVSSCIRRLSYSLHFIHS
jgi:hypothetical protein